MIGKIYNIICTLLYTVERERERERDKKKIQWIVFSNVQWYDLVIHSTVCRIIYIFFTESCMQQHNNIIKVERKYRTNKS